MIDYYQLGWKKFEETKKISWEHDMMPSEILAGRYETQYSYEKWNVHKSERDEFVKGFDDSKNKFLQPYRDKFFKDLEQFEKEHNSSISTGCGCCGGGYYLTINGVEYDIYKDSSSESD